MRLLISRFSVSLSSSFSFHAGPPESIQLYIEDPALRPPPSFSKLSLFLCRERGEGVGEEPNYTTDEKVWSSINHSILSAVL
jgi:hypothetical protein